MNLKLLFICLFLAVLLAPAEVYFFFAILKGENDNDEEDENSEWLFDIQEPEGLCHPNPCHNGGECREKGKRKFKCDCPDPFKGKRCEKGPKICKRGKCGRGECVLTSAPPFYECKCKLPFLPPDCKHYSLCNPNPCKNGGQCIQDGNDFDCQCSQGYRGRFCNVEPNDCFVDDGESYRGNVSETENGDECLYWNSHFILERGVDPFNTFEDPDGLGHHNLCRNPDGDIMPWCFFRRGRKLLWDYCDVTECPEPTSQEKTTKTNPPTDDVPPEPKPTDAKPSTTNTPTKPETTEATKPTDATTGAPPTPTPNTTVSQEEFATCGQPQPKKSMARIYGGLKVPPGEIPWQVSLQVRPSQTSQPFSHICGGVLIASCWVLTAGHCIEKNKDMQVLMGSLSLNSEDSMTQTLDVERAIIHENYRETPIAVYNDIALLKLRGNNGVCANETQFVKTACLPNSQLPDGMECRISGWGATEQSDYGSNHLLEANVLLINQEKCSERNIYGSALAQNMFCAGYLQGGVDSCQGDSGGPLTCQESGAHVIYGLVSWGDQCGKKFKPGVYTRVTEFVDWINAKIQQTSR
uniref:trypsin n=1 Tax=Gouania willdenowi TaxID=441366 RepID=A0A8C5H769_GOUWI